MSRPNPAFLLLVAALACGGESDRVGEPASDGEPPEAFVMSGEVALAYLDWGGEGPPLVLVHGLNSSPHVFSHLARDLREDFRVVAYARRGHGHSDSPEGPYDNTTLTEDLRVLMDSLGIAQAHLLGWSMGGSEITEFAARYPERTLGLVYLEAGYDWPDAFSKGLATRPPWGGRDRLESMEAYSEVWQSQMGRDIVLPPGIDAHFRSTTRVTPDGRVQPVPDSAASVQIVASLLAYSKDYTAVRSPALALYAPDWYATNLDDPEAAQAMVDWEAESWDPFRVASIAKIQAELSGVVVREIPNTTHRSIAFVNTESLVKMIRDFLLEAD